MGLYHNTVAVIDADGSVVGLYRKMHIPDDPAFYEKFYFTPGDLGFQAFDVRPGRIGTLICWDQWYPEAARLTALRGAAVLFYPTAIGWHPDEKAAHGASQRSAWQTIQRSHAIANGVYVAAVNRVGHEVSPEGGPGLEFWGTSFLADPFGVVVAEASTNREEILVGEVDLGHMENVRRNWPFLRDRRIDAYGGPRPPLHRLTQFGPQPRWRLFVHLAGRPSLRWPSPSGTDGHLRPVTDVAASGCARLRIPGCGLRRAGAGFEDRRWSLPARAGTARGFGRRPSAGVGGAGARPVAKALLS